VILTIRPNVFFVESDPAFLLELHQSLSFRDKGAEFQLQRFIRRMDLWETRGIWRHRGFDSENAFIEWRAAEEAALRAKLDVYCCTLSENGIQLQIPIGLYCHVRKYIHDHNRPTLSITDERSFDLPRKNLKGFCPPLRPPQEKALEHVLGVDPVCMIRMATGVGKTLVGQEIIRHYGVKSIFLVPSKSILNQTVRRFTSAFGGSNVGKFGDGRKKHRHVTVATYQSVYHAEAGEFDQYDLVIADECHHVPADTYYEVIENKLRNAVYRFGFTADEERSDGGTILVEAATGPVVFSYDAPQAIQEGYLAQPTFIIYEISRTGGFYIQWQTTEDGDRRNVGICQSEAYTGEDASRAYKNWILGNDLLNEAVANLAAGFSYPTDQNSAQSVLILIDQKEHGDKLMKYLQSYGAELVTGETTNNEEVLARFNARKLRLVIATSTWGEGTDTPPVDVLINLMGGTKTKQANGRALRNDPDENGTPRKTKCLIIDIDVPISPVLHRHSELREAVHQTCGKVYRLQLI
jgi:superfamily II DNA or RNA helicase